MDEKWLPTNPYNKKYAIHKHSAFDEGVNSTAKKMRERLLEKQRVTRENGMLFYIPMAEWQSLFQEIKES